MASEKTGLVMEGGAMRGMFTAGVLDVLMENGIEFDGAIGVSAGATFGCNFKSKQIGRAIRYNKRFCKDWRYCSLRSLIKTGVPVNKSGQKKCFFLIFFFKSGQFLKYFFRFVFRSGHFLLNEFWCFR